MPKAPRKCQPRVKMKPKKKEIPNEPQTRALSLFLSLPFSNGSEAARLPFFPPIVPDHKKCVYRRCQSINQSIAIQPNQGLPVSILELRLSRRSPVGRVCPTASVSWPIAHSVPFLYMYNSVGAAQVGRRRICRKVRHVCFACVKHSARKPLPVK